MEKTVRTEGKTTTEAIEKGLKELGVSKDKVEIKVLEEEKRSFYSILSPRVVKVELTLKEDKKEKNKEEKKHNENIQEIEKAEQDIKEFLDNLLTKLSDIKKCGIDIKLLLDKMIEYFDNIPEGTVVVANAMYEQGFTRMSHDAFFRSIERLCEDC